MKHRISKITLWTLAGIVVLLVALRAAAPYWIERDINARLDHLGDYHGHVEDVSLHLWRGAYELHELVIEKASGKVPVPLLSAPLVDLSISWSALFDGGIVATVNFDRPQISLVDGCDGASSQAGTGVDWRTDPRGPDPDPPRRGDGPQRRAQFPQFHLESAGGYPRHRARRRGHQPDQRAQRRQSGQRCSRPRPRCWTMRRWKPRRISTPSAALTILQWI